MRSVHLQISEGVVVRITDNPFKNNKNDSSGPSDTNPEPTLIQSLDENGEMKEVEYQPLTNVAVESVKTLYPIVPHEKISDLYQTINE